MLLLYEANIEHINQSIDQKSIQNHHKHRSKINQKINPKATQKMYRILHRLLIHLGRHFGFGTILAPKTLTRGEVEFDDFHCLTILDATRVIFAPRGGFGANLGAILVPTWAVHGPSGWHFGHNLGAQTPRVEPKLPQELSDYIQSSNQSINPSINQSINKSINQSLKPSINQSIKLIKSIKSIKSIKTILQYWPDGMREAIE